jgi:hypothetical protein
MTAAQARQSVADTILAQLGGQRFIAMTGARWFTSTERALTFRLSLTSTKNRCNSVVIRLDASDTYTVLFNRRCNGGVDVHGVESATGVFADRLRDVFTQATGLETSL